MPNRGLERPGVPAGQERLLALLGHFTDTDSEDLCGLRGFGDGGFDIGGDD